MLIPSSVGQILPPATLTKVYHTTKVIDELWLPSPLTYVTEDKRLKVRRAPKLLYMPPPLTKPFSTTRNELLE